MKAKRIMSLVLVSTMLSLTVIGCGASQTTSKGDAGAASATDEGKYHLRERRTHGYWQQQTPMHLILKP